ncbi:MAG TPA: hypothetical protein VLE91_02805 [Candidatus Saccharimonadales bacterium]|nr:hypothetical protein [Candidatus Saccharimonadales bacterium]
MSADRRDSRFTPLSELSDQDKAMVLLSFHPGRGFKRFFPGEGTIGQQVLAMDEDQRTNLAKQLASAQAVRMLNLLGEVLVPRDPEKAIKLIDEVQSVLKPSNTGHTA